MLFELGDVVEHGRAVAAGEAGDDGEVRFADDLLTARLDPKAQGADLGVLVDGDHGPP